MDNSFLIKLENIIASEIELYEIQKRALIKRNNNRHKTKFKLRLIELIQTLILKNYKDEIYWLDILHELQFKGNLLKHEKKSILIKKYIDTLKLLNIINSELYHHTEFYETDYMIDYNHELFNVFKNKLGYYTKLANKISDLSEKP